VVLAAPAYRQRAHAIAATMAGALSPGEVRDALFGP